jgi:hypothetical protein
VFHSAASNLVAGDTNAMTDVFVHQQDTGITERISISTSGAERRWTALAFWSPSPVLRATWSPVTPTGSTTSTCATVLPEPPSG